MIYLSNIHRHHKGSTYYEKYDKSRDSEILCAACLRACKEITCSMDFKKQTPDTPFFFEKEQVIPLLRLTMNPIGEDFCRRCKCPLLKC